MHDDLRTDRKDYSKYLKYIIVFIIIILLMMIIKILFLKKDNFSLVGNEVILKYNEEYQEPGYNYIDKNGNDLTNMVIVINNVKNNAPGDYEILYQYNDKVLKRKVKVLDPESYDLIINYSINNDKLTNSEVIINYNVEGEAFKEVVLPTKETVENKSGNFSVQENGTYKIIAYNIQGTKYSQDIVVENIDKEKPTGQCHAILNVKNSEYKVKGKDNKGIVKYEYYDGEQLLTSIILDNYVTTDKTGKDLAVKVYDEAGNSEEIKCEIEDKSFYEPIIPTAGENVIFKGETDTLKAYIIDNKSYYLTRIWVRDAYTQLNKAVSPEYGKKLYQPSDLLKKEVEKENLTDKLIIGFNASGFYLKDVHDADSVRKYSAYDKTSVGTIIINNGQVIRNFYDHAVKQWYLTGITKDNKMVVFEDNVAVTSEAIAAKKIWSEEVINSGIRNTFSFAGPVILNGQKLTTFSTSLPHNDNQSTAMLQLICQINENNYALFTSVKTNRQKAIDVFYSIGCQTAINLDGGGSTALLYKEKNSTKINTLFGGERQLTEAGYFTE